MPSPPAPRRTLTLFVGISLALHLLLVAGFVVPTFARRARAARVAAESRDPARRAAEERRRQAARAADEARREAARQAAADARRQVADELRHEFQSVAGEQLKGEAADRVWDDILARMTAGLDDYARELADGGVSDAELRQRMTDLQGQMLGELAGRLRGMGAKELADAFVSRVENEVAPKLVDYYRRQIQARVGNALREEGSRIVREDAAEVRARRQAIAQALLDAERQARSAGSDLAAAQNRLRATTRAAETARDGGKAEEAEKKLSDAARAERDRVESAGRAVESAGQKLREAAEKADVLGAEANGAIRDAVAGADEARRQAGKAADDARADKAADLAGSAGDAAAAAGRLADAARAARDVAAKDNEDPSREARLALRHARDEQVRDLIEKAFWENYGQRTAPRLGERLTGAFRQTLEQGGVRDEAVVAEVGKRVQAALVEKVRDKVQAGQVGTDPLTKAERLDEVADGAAAAGGPHASPGRHGAGPPSTGPAEGNEGGTAGGSSAAGAGGTAAARGGSAAPTTRAAETAGNDAPATRPSRQEAVAERLNKAARELVGTGMAGVGDDAGGDDAAVAAAAGPGGRGRGGADGEEADPPGVAGLAERVGRLADNVKGGRTDLADATRGAPGAGTGTAAGAGAGAPGPGLPGGPGGGVGLARLYQGLIDRSHGPLLRYHGRYVNDAEYQQLTAGIHDRDRLAARGQPTTRRSADAEAASPPPPADDPAAPRAETVLVPAPPTTEPAGEPGKAEPFKPNFKTVRYAAIPYRSRPVTIDGDLSEWADVPELPMKPATEHGPKNPEWKVFPQSVKAQWDSTGFYLAYDVKDADNKITKVKAGNFWEGDGIEFWVDTLNTKEKYRTECSHQFWAWVEGSDGDAALVGGEAREWKGHDEYVPLGRDVIRTASRRTDGGWTMEVFVPASRFRMLDLQPGRVLGMNCSICTGTDLYYYWAGTAEVATSRRPDTWGDVLLAGSAGRLQCVDRLAAELKPGEAAKAVNAVRVGEPLRVRVSDADMNLSETARDRLAVVVSTGRGARQTLILEETGEATGVFEGALRTAPDTGETPPGVLPLLDGDVVELTYTDQCRPDGARDVPVKLKLPTAAAVTRVGE